MMHARKLLALLLCAVMLLSVLPMTAAAETSGLQNFKKVNDYSVGIFSDVSTSDWFADNVKAAYELGLMIGQGENFGVESNLTIAEAVTLAARLHSIYSGDNKSFVPVSPWYQVYVNYVKSKGLVSLNGLDMTAPATRAQFAKILAGAFPNAALKCVNNVADDAIPDVKLADDGAEAVYKLYRAGILVGNDAQGTFAPNSNIKRSEVAAIVTRMADSGLRKAITLGEFNTVTFDLNYPTVIENQIVFVEAGKTVSAPLNPKRSGFRFNGWYTAASGGTKFDFSKPITKDTTLFAHWIVDSYSGEGQNFSYYTVSFDSNGGSKVPSQSVASGKTAKEPVTPTKDGYAFVGWYTSNSFDELFLFGEEGDIINENITLFADWETTDLSASLLDYAISEVVIGYQRGDNAKNVTRDICLPTYIESLPDVTVLWESNNPSIISENGTVSRPQSRDETVCLTLTVSKGDISQNSDFLLTVIHINNRNKEEISDNSESDIQSMNNDEAVVVYNDDHTQVKSIEGQFSEIVVENADDALDVIQSIHTILGISDPYNELAIETISSDNYGAEYTFNQYFMGTRVYGRSVTVSADENGITDSLSSGFCATTIISNSNMSIRIEQDDAEKIAMNLYGDDTTVDSSRTDLVVYSLDEFAEFPIYSYIVDVRGTDQNGKTVAENVFVDADTGNVFLTMPLFLDDSTKTGSGKNELGNKTSFPVSFTLTDWFFFYMRDLDLNIQMYSQAFGIDFRVGSEFNRWTDGQQISAYNNMREVIKWWRDEFGRNSLDDNGMKVNVIAHDSSLKDNAFWDPDDESIHICDTEKKIAMHSRAVATDVITHESTHAVIQYRVGSDFASNYRNAPGAINEGYADIFGCLENNNWTHGESLYESNSRYLGNTITCTRNIANPSDTHALSQGPDRLSSPLYIDYTTNSSDNGGVHTNSFLISHAAYLMNTYGMSMGTLKSLWYKSMRMGYDATSDFHSVRVCALKAAKKLHFSDESLSIIRRAFDEEEIYGQNGWLKGTVKDENQQTISGITVMIYDVNDQFVSSAITDSNGEFSVSLRENKYTIRIIADGYDDFSITKLVEENKNNFIGIKLISRGVQCALSGKITIADTDTDLTNNLPLEGATIQLEGISNSISLSTFTSTDGTYSFESFPAGNYTVTISKTGYLSLHEVLTISNDVPNYYNATIEAISEEYRGVGSASGTVYDAINGYAVSGLTLNFRAGIGVTSDAVVITVMTDNYGKYLVESIPAGNYTVEVVDSRNLEESEERYYSSTFSVKILGGQLIANQNGYVTNGLSVDQIRIVLRWGSSPSDLDSHLVGPTEAGNRFHTFFSSKSFYESSQLKASLDLDDTSSYGPETTTIYEMSPGIYTYLVHDYSNRSSTSSSVLSNSGAYIEVYLGTSTFASYTFYVPHNPGTVWAVFSYNSETGIISPINEMSYQSEPSSIGSNYSVF